MHTDVVPKTGLQADAEFETAAELYGASLATNTAEVGALRPSGWVGGLVGWWVGGLVVGGWWLVVGLAG